MFEVKKKEMYRKMEKNKIEKLKAKLSTKKENGSFIYLEVLQTTFTFSGKCTFRGQTLFYRKKLKFVHFNFVFAVSERVESFVKY